MGHLQGLTQVAHRRQRGLAVRIVAWAGLLVALIGAGVWMIAMPGSNPDSPLPALTPAQVELAGRLQADVRALADEIGERNMHRAGSLDEAAAWIEHRFEASGYRPERHTYELRGHAMDRYAGDTAHNVIAEVRGSDRPDEIIIVGAHYDTVPGSPGANDNASAVAVLLALAARFAERRQPRTLRFIAFVNEEPPFYRTPDMGSYAYARERSARGERITAMMSMDGVGYYSDEPGSQRYPLPGLGLAYPDTGDFIGFVTRMRDAGMMRRALGAFRETGALPAEGAALPGILPGVGWSDHWSFWQHGYSAFLVTDTLPFRDPDYHRGSDTAERLDYARMARLTEGLEAVVIGLAE